VQIENGTDSARVKERIHLWPYLCEFGDNLLKAVSLARTIGFKNFFGRPEEQTMAG
jgi:hypothetical protein